MAKKKRIGIIASGGDGSGMNACIYYLSKFLIDGGYEPVYFENGYEGIVNNKKVEMTLRDLRRFVYDGGCMIGAGRSAKYMTDEGRRMAVDTMNKENVECFIVIGGNGSIKGIVDGAEFGFRGIGIPATIDNDAYYSDYAIGYDSAANANLNVIKSVKVSCFATNKLPIVEIMGRDCGKLTMTSAVGSGADICVVKEVPKTIDDICEEVRILKKAGRSRILIVIAEKNFDLQELAKRAGEAFDQDVRTFVSGYAQRGPDASAFDRALAASLASEAYKDVVEGKYNVTVGANKSGTFSMCIKEAVFNTPATFNHCLYDTLFNIKKNYK